MVSNFLIGRGWACTAKAVPAHPGRAYAEFGNGHQLLRAFLRGNCSPQGGNDEEHEAVPALLFVRDLRFLRDSCYVHGVLA